MTVYRVVGIDPGLVHTGLVVTEWHTGTELIARSHEVIQGATRQDHVDQVVETLSGLGKLDRVFIESYRNRGNSYGTDPAMRELMQMLRAATTRWPVSVLDNTGVKKVVRAPLMKAVGLTGWPTTHHQDLESAARILLYGMLKDPDLNQVVAEAVIAHVDGRGWTVHE